MTPIDYPLVSFTLLRNVPPERLGHADPKHINYSSRHISGGNCPSSCNDQTTVAAHSTSLLSNLLHTEEIERLLQIPITVRGQRGYGDGGIRK